MRICPFGFALLLSALAVSAAEAQTCAESAAFYEAGGYTVAKVEIDSPFRFLSVVGHRLQGLKEQLALQENARFTVEAYNGSFAQVEAAVNAPGVFGDAPVKVVWIRDQVRNCSAGAKTLEVAYTLYSTDPILAVAHEPGPTALDAAQQSVAGRWKLEPLLGYDVTRRGFGGGDLILKLPGKFAQDLHVMGSGSSSSGMVNAQLDGGGSFRKLFLDRLEYHLAYRLADVPAGAVQLSKSVGSLRFTGFAKPVETPLGSVGFRYGGSGESGNQHGSLVRGAIPADVLVNSGDAALRFYAGVTSSARYVSTTASYGVQRGGRALNDLSFTKQIADVAFNARVPGAKHRPFDSQARLSAGRILTSTPVPLNERFFGGNVATEFIPGDAWLIPNGPLVRSIPMNRLNGGTFGGTSFYSVNVTAGKTIFGSPLIPADIASDPGFSQGLNAAEETAQNFFADDYESSSPEFKQAVAAGAAKLKVDLETLQVVIRDASSASRVFTELGNFARRSLTTVQHATTPDEHGQIHSLEIKTLLNPAVSFVTKAIALIPEAAAVVPEPVALRLRAQGSALQADVDGLKTALDGIHNGPVGAVARAKAARDMIRPREAIDTLRREVNSYSVALVGIFDAGRLRPDPYGIRYAIGGGVRLSLVNVNFTLGYARNPHPVRALQQGPGALFLQMTYTDLFR